MNTGKNVQEDLGYVRTVLDRAEGESTSPASIYFLWAAIVFFGYSIIDFVPEKTGFYWIIAGPVGGILSGVLGARAARRSGRGGARSGRYEALHWTGLFAAILLLVPLAAGGAIDMSDFPRLILLLVAAFYFTAGIHVDRRLLPVSGAIAVCYLLTVFARQLPYLWSTTAAILAGSLVVAGSFAAARERGQPRAPRS